MGNDYQQFDVETPDEMTAPRMVKTLSETDLLRGGLQVIEPNTRNVLHRHTGNEGFWLVLEGSATFYTDEDVVIGDLTKLEGIHIPLDYPYWFESGDDGLTLLHVSAHSDTIEDEQIDLESRENGSEFEFYY